VCGAFHLADVGEASIPLERLYSNLSLQNYYRPAGDVHPNEIVPVISRRKSGNIGCNLMQWGFTLEGRGGLIINARSETAFSKPLFSVSMASRRCLVPITCYYEWKKDDAYGKQKFSFTPDSAAPCYLAGIYRYESNPSLPRFIVLTRPATPDIAFIHSRMPVILTGAQATAWLSPESNPALLLAQANTTLSIHHCP